MKYLTVAALCVTFIVVVSARPEEQYTDQYDNVDVDEILNKPRLKNAYINCLKTGDKCTKEGKKLRDILPDALQNGCEKCTDIQKEQSKKVIRHLIQNNPGDFKDLENIFDPNRQYRKNFADLLQKEGIVLPD